MREMPVVIAALVCSTLAASAGTPISSLSAEPVQRAETVRSGIVLREARMQRRNIRRERRDDYCRNTPRACR